MAFPAVKPANGVIHRERDFGVQQWTASANGWDTRPVVFGNDIALPFVNEHIMPIARDTSKRAQNMVRAKAYVRWPSLDVSNFLFNLGVGHGWYNPTNVFYDCMGRISRGDQSWFKAQWNTAFHTTEGVYANYADNNVQWKCNAQKNVQFDILVQRLAAGACSVRWYLTAAMDKGNLIWMANVQGYWEHDISDLADIRFRLDTQAGGYYYSEAW